MERAIGISEAGEEFFKEQTKKLGITEIQFLNEALLLMKWAIAEIEKGRLVASIDEESKVFAELDISTCASLKNASELAKKNRKN